MKAPGYQGVLRRYARYADHYDRSWGRYSHLTLEATLGAIPEGSADRTFVDVACGTGLLAEMIRGRWPSSRIVGVDMTPQMLERARQKMPEDAKTRWMVGPAEDLPIESGMADVLTCTNAFHLVQQPRVALGEFRRVLKAGGSLVLVDWCLDSLVMRFRAAALKLLDSPPRQIRTTSAMATMLRQASFNVSRRERFTIRGGWTLMLLCAQPSVRPTPAASVPSSGRRPAMAEVQLSRRAI